MNRLLFSLSPIGGEGWGEGAPWFMAPMRVQSRRLRLSMNLVGDDVRRIKAPQKRAA